MAVGVEELLLDALSALDRVLDVERTARAAGSSGCLDDGQLAMVGQAQLRVDQVVTELATESVGFGFDEADDDEDLDEAVA